MPFIPHTPEDIEAMLATIGVDNIADLFDEIPSALAAPELDAIPDGINEMDITRQMIERSPQLNAGSCFIGAGAYEHHIPAAIGDLMSRGEFYTAYTPYQAEASQGGLQLIYEYQTMMAQLMGMEVSNASLYDGATSLSEALLMAVRIKRSKAKRVLVPTTVHPHYRQVLHSVLKHQDIVIEELAYDVGSGRVDPQRLQEISGDGLAAVVVPQPNFFGVLEEVDALVDIAHAKDALVVAVVNPTAMALLKPPGEWGQRGADIVCGEGQALGAPLASGGPYFGFMCCNKDNVRQMPGRLVGCTTDHEGRRGFTLTLQAREQHIRRGKATSNICTNQGLMVVVATIYMSLLGAQGLREVAMASHHQAGQLYERLLSIDGVSPVFNAPFFHEFVVRVNASVTDVLDELAENGIQGGYALQQTYPNLGDALLVCVTEVKTTPDLERYQHLMAKAVA